MTAKEQALKDIREYLRGEGKSFLAYSKVLSSVINAITEDYLTAQESKSKK